MAEIEKSPSRRDSPLLDPVDAADKQEGNDNPTNVVADFERSAHSQAPQEKDRERKRSVSPENDRRRDRPRRKDAGFKWKEQRQDNHERRDQDEGLKRGYKDHYRPRSRSRSPRRRSDRGYDDRDRRRNREERNTRDQERATNNTRNTTKAPPPQNFILVYVNDRLGTKTAIPCFPTDTIKNFKAFVASKIGRQPHEILIKRQGERPFKDILTLQDYGVSNNVQLDLEVDTGD